MLREFFRSHRKISVCTQTESTSTRSIATPTSQNSSTDNPYYFPPPALLVIPSVLYSDKFCQLTKLTLLVRHFPSGNGSKPTSHVIALETVRCVFHDDQHGALVDYFAVALYGRHDNIVWARDDTRYEMTLCCCSAPRSGVNVVLDTGQRLRTGFSVENGSNFLAVLRVLLGRRVTFTDRLP